MYYCQLSIFFYPSGIISLYCCYFLFLSASKWRRESNEWSNLLLWLRQDSDSSVVMFNAPTLPLYSPNSLKSLSLSFRISEHKQQIVLNLFGKYLNGKHET